jgi:hypothetical protein
MSKTSSQKRLKDKIVVSNRGAWELPNSKPATCGLPVYPGQKRDDSILLLNYVYI